MDTMLNELSLNQLSPSVDLARQRMVRFVQVLSSLKSISKQTLLRVPRGFRQHTLADGYVVENWIRDRDFVSEEYRKFLLEIASRAPYLDDLWDHHMADGEFECYHGETLAKGFGVAHLADSPAVGLDGIEEFADDPVPVKIVYLDSTDVVEEVAQICCITSQQQVASRTAWLTSKIQSEKAIANGEDLWDRRIALLPRLDFSNGTKSYLCSLSHGNPALVKVYEHLRTLNETCELWTGGAFIPVGIDWTDESPETMAEPLLANQRIFRCHDGIRRTITTHSKIKAFNLRIYFLGIDSGNQQDRRVIVGYIGRHLPTVNFKT